METYRSLNIIVNDNKNEFTINVTNSKLPEIQQFLNIVDIKQKSKNFHIIGLQDFYGYLKDDINKFINKHDIDHLIINGISQFDFVDLIHKSMRNGSKYITINNFDGVDYKSHLRKDVEYKILQIRDYGTPEANNDIKMFIDYINNEQIIFRLLQLRLGHIDYDILNTISEYINNNDCSDLILSYQQPQTSDYDNIIQFIRSLYYNTSLRRLELTICYKDLSLENMKSIRDELYTLMTKSMLEVYPLFFIRENRYLPYEQFMKPLPLDQREVPIISLMNTKSSNKRDSNLSID